MSKVDKLKKYMLKEMKKIMIKSSAKRDNTTFAFCWGQAKFDVLMDIDRELELGVFYKKEK